MMQACYLILGLAFDTLVVGWRGAMAEYIEGFTLVEKNEEIVKGWVADSECLARILEAHSIDTGCQFISWHDDRKKREKEANRRLLWKHKDVPLVEDQPFLLKRNIIKQCQYGKEHKKSEKNKKSVESDHEKYAKTRRYHIQRSRKVGCTAQIVIRFVTVFMDVEYSSKGLNQRSRKRQQILDQLKYSMKSSNDCKAEERIYISLPLSKAHTNHTITPLSSLGNRINKKVQEKIYELVQQGITNVPVVKKLLKVFVESEFANEDLKPSIFDRAYYPLSRDIKNHIHLAIITGQSSHLDQDNLQKKIQVWQKEDPNRSIFFRPASVRSDDGADTDLDSFLLVHQEEWQKRLLGMYGNTMCLLDATYKTTKYAVPFFMLVVRTNVDYIPVAEFVLEEENATSIQEALGIIQSWNPAWNPQYMMVDYSEAEMNAIRHQFSSVNIHVCAFHREQAWERWSKSEKNISHPYRDDFLEKMRMIAYATDEASYDAAVNSLRSSEWFKKSKAVQRYIQNQWLNVKEYWCRAFMDIGFHTPVTTTNGVESLNKTLKHFYLKLSSSGALTNLMEVVMKGFLPDLYHNYVMLNYRCSSNFRQYNEEIPEYLHNRPRSLVEHCMIRKGRSGDLIVTPQTNNNFTITSGSNIYTLRLGSDHEMPFCTCDDFRSQFLPCKHMFAVFEHTEKTWNDLGVMFLGSPYVKLDDSAADQKQTKVNKKEECIELDEGDKTESDVSEVDETLISTPPQKKEAKKNLSVIQREVVTELKNLQSMVYLCEERSILESVQKDLLSVKKILSSSIPRETGLPIYDASKFRPLPGRRKYFKRAKKYNRRVGRRAKVMKDAANIDIASNSRCNSMPRKEYTSRLKDVHHQEEAIESETVTEDAPATSKLNENTGLQQQQQPSTSFNVDDYTQNEIKKFTNVEEDDIQAMEAVNMLWSLDRDCNVPVAKVNQMKVYDTDIRSLRPNEWLTDLAMDSYLAVLATIQNDLGGKVIQYVQTKMTNIINGEHTVNRPRDGAPCTVPEVEADKIIGTYHTLGHWSLVIIEVQNGRIFYYNPTGEHWATMNKIKRNWQKYIHDVQEAFGVRFRTAEWSVNKNLHTRQTDGCNCGVYCLMFAEKHLSGNLSGLTRITDSDIIETRQKVAKDLMLYEVFLDGCCPKCGFDIEDNEVTIECRSCARGFHFRSYCIEEDLKDLGEHSDFVCKLCRINFWKRRPVASKSRRIAETTKQRINEHDHETVEKDEMPSSKRSRKGEIHFTFREGLRKDRKKRKRSSFLYETPKKKSRPRFCSCNKPDDGRKYWLCDKCNIWFHPTCLGLKEDVEPEIFYCKSCQVIQINSDEDTADVGLKKPRGAFSDNSSDDSDEGTKKDKIDSTFIESKSSQVKQLLKDILSCDNNDCDEHSHIRHHEFTRNSVIFSIRSKRKCSYGTDYFKTKTIEDLQKKLINEYLYSISDPKYPVSGAKISLIRNVQEGTALYALLTDKKLIALDYICLVLAKEVLTLLVALKSGMPLELADEKCKATEIDMRRKAR